ncbi:hypothetical protein [Streptomyces sp. NPDC005017]|uniref:hypothetical protein n=1 Tax=Streptomyces sp. NPDC005017 TaxID=3364706 RepID=UPI003680C2BD
MAQLKPISLDVIAEARDEAHLVLARLMAPLAPGKHVIRLAVGMDDTEEILSSLLPVAVAGDAGAEALVSVDRKDFDNFVFLLTVGLVQTLCWGALTVCSLVEDGPTYAIRAWCLEYGALAECSAALAAELIDGHEPASFEDAFSIHSVDEDGEAVYPPVAYTIL